MRRIAITVLIGVLFAFAAVASTVTFPAGPRQGGSLASAGVRNVVFTFDDQDVNGTAVSPLAAYGVVQRIVIDCNGTETAWSVALRDSLGVTMFSKSDCNSVTTPHSYAIYQDDTEGNPHYGIPVCGTLTVAIDDVNSAAEIQTLSPDVNATHGPYWLGYGAETTAHVSEMVMISEVNEPNGGTFELTFADANTSPLAYDANIVDINAALVALTTIDTNEVVCTGGPLPDSAIFITFAQGLGYQNVGAITLTDNSLTATDGDDTASYAISVLREGEGLVYDANIVEIQAALEALSGVEPNDIVVGGGPVSEDSNDTTFTFPAAAGNVPMLTIDFTYLTGPTACPITQTIRGGSDLDAIDVTVFYLENAQ